MLTAAVFSVILAAAAAKTFPPVGLPSSCAAMSCPIGTVCREEPNKKGDVEARCERLVASKPGDCPIPDPVDYSICDETCSQDGQCSGDEKCCETICGGRTCRQPRPSCDMVRCRFGQKCVMSPVYCVRVPCNRQPVCVDIEKPGECPKSGFVPQSYLVQCRIQCSADDECPGDRKCCEEGCAALCQDPVTCATKECGRDHKCVMRRKCNKRSCSQTPECEPVKRCPFYPAWINPNCLHEHRCEVDDPDACPVGTLCCSTDCGRRCVTPMEE